MSLYAPFYAAKNRPIGAVPPLKKLVTRKASPKAASVKAASVKRASVKAASVKPTDCGNAARRLVSCRSGKRDPATRGRGVRCTRAGKNLIACRWRR